MKTKLLFLTLLLATSVQFINAQCSRNATDVGNNASTPSYNVSGDIEVVYNTNNTITLNLGSNFSTASGPDVRVYLVASNGLTDQQLTNTTINNLTNVQFGLVSSNTVNPNGAKSFTINAPTSDIETYDRVFFYCLQFNAFWDFGKITAFNQSNCTVLGVEENTLKNQVNFFPNPSRDNITISNDKKLDLSVTILDLLGKVVISKKATNVTNQEINLQSLKSGVYLLQLNSNGTTVTKKLIKQ